VLTAPFLTSSAFVLLAGAGASVRFLAGRPNGRWPGGHVGTMAVNVAGSFALGLLAGTGDATLTMVGTGGLGALTTFSTFAADAVGMTDTRVGRRNGRALGHIVNTLVLGVGAAALGLHLAD